MHYLDYDDTANRVLGTILARQAAENGDTTFLVFDQQRFTFSQVFDEARQFAVGLAAAGVKRGDNICIFMSSCPEFVFLTLACNLLGAHWIPVNTDYRGRWLRETLEQSEPALLVVDSELLERVQALQDLSIPVYTPGGASGALDLQSLRAANVDGFVPADCHYGDTSSVLWTSGTTGRSNGVMQSHNCWVRSALSAAQLGDLGAGDITYCCMPMYNSAAWVTSIYPALVSGTTAAVDPVFTATQFWDRTRYYGATHIFTLGAMHMFLWGAPAQPNDADNPVRSANMIPMPADIHRPFCERFGIDAIHQGFGQSEVMLLLNRKDDGVKEWPPNALGSPPDDIELALLDDDNQPVAPGEAGEFCVKELSPHVLFNGYFNNPQATDNAFRGGWYHTGDMGRQDEAGNFYFLDRKKDLIRYKGRSVSSVAVESVVRSHPALADVAVFGIPSAELASEHEIMLAAIKSPEASVTETEIARFINDNAPYFFVPRYIEFVDSLPMTPTQKVRKVELRERGLTPATWDAKAAGFEVQR